MKKLFLSLVATMFAVLLPTSVSAQMINGDLNHSGKLEVSDVTHLINNYLTGTAETISGGGDPFAVDNSRIVGTWYKSKTESVTFNADGTTDYADGYTFEFLPLQGYVVFYNVSYVPVYALRVLKITSDQLMTLPAGCSVPEVYSITQPVNPGSGVNNGHEYVDLGLSVKWATMNVGASSPEYYGDYFAWGETTTKTTYNWSTYKYCNGSYTTMTKYCTDSSYGTVDNKTVLELSDDAACVNWGGTWRMPTDAELTELRTQCTWTWTTQNGVKGYKVTSKTNSNSIFLPAAGCRYDSSLSNAGSYGSYWSSSLSKGPYDAWYVYFFSGGVYRDYDVRYYGLSVRPVCQ